LYGEHNIFVSASRRTGGHENSEVRVIQYMYTDVNEGKVLPSPEYNAMEAYRSVKVKLHVFLITVLDAAVGSTCIMFSSFLLPLHGSSTRRLTGPQT
jgi:hypothetical protein